MFCGSFFWICVDNYYNTILPYFYLYYFNEYVGANLKGNIKNWAYGYIDCRRKKGPLSKNDFGPAEAVGRSQTRPVEFFGRGPFYYSN